ncbi:MAG: sigma-70 family RNA polymerase sigma factor [Saprospiraceae bacterium]
MDDEYASTAPPATPKPDYTADWHRLRDGDMKAWNTLYKEAFDIAIRHSQGREWSYDEKRAVFEDAYDTLVDKVIEKKEYDVTKKPSVFLKGIITNKYHEHRRRNITKPGLPEDGGPSDPLKEHEERQSELKETAMDCFHSLEERCREVLELTIVENLPHEEVARILGCSVKYVRVLKHRCMTRLRECFRGKRKTS